MEDGEGSGFGFCVRKKNVYFFCSLIEVAYFMEGSSKEFLKFSQKKKRLSKVKYCLVIRLPHKLPLPSIRLCVTFNNMLLLLWLYILSWCTNLSNVDYEIELDM